MPESMPRTVIENGFATVPIDQLGDCDPWGYRAVRGFYFLGGVKIADDSPRAPICYDHRYYTPDNAIDAAAALLTAATLVDDSRRAPQREAEVTGTSVDAVRKDANAVSLPDFGRIGPDEIVVSFEQTACVTCGEGSGWVKVDETGLAVVAYDRQTEHAQTTGHVEFHHWKITRGHSRVVLG